MREADFRAGRAVALVAEAAALRSEMHLALSFSSANTSGGAGGGVGMITVGFSDVATSSKFELVATVGDGGSCAYPFCAARVRLFVSFYFSFSFSFLISMSSRLTISFTMMMMAVVTTK